MDNEGNDSETLSFSGGRICNTGFTRLVDDIGIRKRKETPTVKYLTRKQLAVFLSEQGYPGYSLSTLNKLCAPALDLGPTPAAYSGDRPLYTSEAGLAWAEARLSATRSKVRGCSRPSRAAAA
jgi:hypothetical protein